MNLNKKQIDTDYEQEHLDKAKLAEKNFDVWLDLIIWDLLEIQDDPKKVDILLEDIKIIKNNNPEITIDSIEKSIKLIDSLEKNNKILYNTKIIDFVIEKLTIVFREYSIRPKADIYGINEDRDTASGEALKD
jgi:hypothetical protein